MNPKVNVFLKLLMVRIGKVKKDTPKEKPGATEGIECKQVEMDDWLFEFPQLFHSHDQDAHILTRETLEETVTSEEAQDSLIKLLQNDMPQHFNSAEEKMKAATDREQMRRRKQQGSGTEDGESSGVGRQGDVSAE